MAADNRYRRKLITWRTELDGLIPTYGDLVATTHDMPPGGTLRVPPPGSEPGRNAALGGQGGEVVAWDPDASVLTVSEPLDGSADGDHFVALRRRDGSLAGPFQVEPVAGEPRQLHVLEALGFTPYTSSAEERTHFAFGPGESWGTRARVIAVRPRGEQVEITAVAEDARVHEAVPAS